jgi:hypothetical protein
VEVLMKVVTKSSYNLWDSKSFVAIFVDGIAKADFIDGEPEDNTIGRNFGDIYKIPELMQMAYEAGKNGESLEFEKLEVEWEDMF